MEASLRIAREAFPAPTGCRGHETLRMDDTATDVLEREDVDGYFVGETCTIVMPPTTHGDPVAWCSTLVHETGHAAGWWHDPRPGTLMHTDATTWDPCRPLVAFRRPSVFHPLAQARRDAARRPSHDWTCRRESRHLARCVGEPGPAASTVGEIGWSRPDREHAWTGRVTYRRGDPS